jgi:hypothetical protein
MKFVFKVLINIVFLSQYSFSQQPEIPIPRAHHNPTKSNLAPPQAGPPPDYKKLNHAAAIMRECLSTLPSPDPNQGCVDSLRLLHDHCRQQRMAFYYYKRTNQEIFKDAEYCPLVDDSYMKLSNLFKLDEQKCIKGFETVANRIESFHKNKAMLEPEDRFVYEYEKSNCKDYKRYVNFCVFVDGDLKNVPASRDEYLPKLTYLIDKKASCNVVNDSIGSGSAEIDNLLFNYMSKKENDVYNNAIKDLRRQNIRTISSTTGKTVNGQCEQVRSSYLNLGCQKWENVSDEDPIYMSEDQMKERRLKKLDDAANSDK